MVKKENMYFRPMMVVIVGLFALSAANLIGNTQATSAPTTLSPTTKSPTTRTPTAPTSSPTTTAPTSPTPAPTIGCTSADTALWKSRYYWTFNSVLDTCGKSSAGDRPKATTCLTGKQPGFSTACIKCEVDLIVCTRDYCLAECVNNGRDNPDCVTCVNLHCVTDYTACSTYDPESCSGCVQVTDSPTIVAGLPNSGLYGVIGGGVALLAVASFVCWKFKCCHNRDHVVTDAPTLTSGPSSSSSNLKQGYQPSLSSPPSAGTFQYSMPPPQQQMQMAPMGYGQPQMAPMGYGQPQMSMMPQAGGGYVQLTPEQQQQVMMLMMQQQQQQPQQFGYGR